MKFLLACALDHLVAAVPFAAERDRWRWKARKAHPGGEVEFDAYSRGSSSQFFAV